MGDTAQMGSHFCSYRHREIIFFTILSVLARRRGGLAAWQPRLQRLDRALLDAVPWAGRYGWETVIVLER